MYKSKRSKACDISREVKEKVWERDKRCVYCGRPSGLPNAHYIPRSKGGLGIEENIVTLCVNCHRNFDQTDLRQHYKEYIKNYLQSKYPGWNEEKLVYRKWNDEL